MRFTRARTTAGLMAAALILTACGGESDTTSTASGGDVIGQVKVTPGTDKTTPKITLAKKSVSTTKTEVKTLKEGTGAPVTKDDIVTLDIALFNGKDGSLIKQSDTYAQEPIGLDMGAKEMFAGLRDGVVGQKVGGSGVAVIPPKDMFGETGNKQLGVAATDSVVMVYDVKGVMLKEAKGKTVAPKKGMPTVTYSTDKPATFTMPKGKAPTSTEVEKLVAGDGATLKKGDTVYVSYTGALWKNGKVFDSSKNTDRRPFPVQLGAGTVIKAWDEGLVGQKVGDRVLLVVPPKDGYGKTGSPDGTITKNDTIVFVIDILGKV